MRWTVRRRVGGPRPGAQDGSLVLPLLGAQPLRAPVVCNRARGLGALRYGGRMAQEQPRRDDGKWMSPGTPPAPATPPIKRRRSPRCNVSLRARALRRRAERAGVLYDKSDSLGTMLAVAHAEASQTCDRLDDALSRAGQLTGVPVEVARQLVRDGYAPETAAMASVLVLGVR